MSNELLLQITTFKFNVKFSFDKKFQPKRVHTLQQPFNEGVANAYIFPGLIDGN